MIDDLLNQQMDIEVIVINGTRLDVFEGSEFLVKKLGFVMSSIEGVVREPEDITKRHDVNSGDFIVFDTPFDKRIMVVGYDIGDPKRIHTIMGYVGHALELPENTRIGTNVLNLRDDDVLREVHNEMMSEYKARHAEAMESMYDIYLVEATTEEFYDYVIAQRNRTDAPNAIINNALSEDPNEPVEVETLEDVVDGLFIIGQSESDKGLPQTGFIVHELTDEQIIDMLKEIMSDFDSVLYEDRDPKIVRELFKDSRLSGTI